MPTRKQRRRHQKARRHKYEYVYLDDEGKEIPVEPSELRAERNGQRDSKPRKSGSGGRAAVGRGGGSGRKVEPPSWRRSGRRALLLGPILVVAMMLLNRSASLGQQIAPAVLMISVFIPFSYFTDSLAYRMYRRRVDAGRAPKPR